MLYYFSKFCKRFFTHFDKTDTKIIKSSGLVFIRDFMIRTGLMLKLETNLSDNRHPIYCVYGKTEIISGIILRIFDGELRLYDQRNPVNDAFYQESNCSNNVPHFTTLRYYIQKNPSTEYDISQTIIEQVEEEATKRKLKTLTIDIDQTGKVLYGNGSGVCKGYVAGRKNQKCYQLQVCYVRELSMIFKIELNPGKMHCAKDFLNKIKYIVKKLNKDGRKLRIICDSGYENEEVFEYLENKDVEFIFARKKRKNVKIRGKNSKNKKEINKFTEETELIIKERKWKNHREIFIQNKLICDEFGQYWIKEFQSDEFTNVLVTNFRNSIEEIYEDYKQRAIVETVIKELKNEFGFGIAHNKTMKFNRIMACLVALSYNIKNLFVKELIEQELYTFKAFPGLRTLRNIFLHVPGILVNNSNIKKLKISGYYFEKWEKIIKFYKYNFG